MRSFSGTRVAAVTTVGATITTLWYQDDHLGGTNVITDSLGAKKEVIEYSPFGEFSRRDRYGSSAETAWYYFTGKPYDDETGLIYFGARYYDPRLARFITADTVVQDPYDPQTLNRYSYCGNNPVNHIDPDGHSWWKKVKKFFQKWGDFISPFGRAVITGEWKHFAVFTVTAIGMALAPNPWLFAAGGLSLGSQATANIGDNASREISRALGYASIAAGVVGTGIEIKKGFDSFTQRQGTVKQYEKELVRNRTEALQKGTNDTVDFYSRGVDATGGIANHDALVSPVFKNGSWEMGPDMFNNISTSNTVPDLAKWSTHQSTAKAIANGAKPLTVQVNNDLLVRSVELFDKTFVGQVKYIALSNNSNYAVNSVLYGAGANIASPLGYGGFRAPGFPTISPYMYDNR